MIKLIKNLFKIAKLISIDDSGDLRTGRASALGKEQRVLAFSPYGLIHNPPPKSISLMWSQQGQESNGITISDDPENRTLKNLSIGEVAISNYETGDYIIFNENNEIKVISSGRVIVESPIVDVTATTINATATTITATAPTINLAATNVNIVSTTLTHNSVNIGETHTHAQANDSAGNTEQPTGVPQ